MCGIIFAKSFQGHPVNEKIIDIYQDQYIRGRDGFGFAYQTIPRKKKEEPKIQVARGTTEAKILNNMQLFPSDMIMFHHRQPTSSPNKLSQTHPLFVSNNQLKHDYYLIHNGVMRNERTLKIEHEKAGFYYETDMAEEKKFNDSETLAIEFAMWIEGLTKEFRAEGSVAFIALQLNKEKGSAEKLFYYRNTNPIKFYRDQREMVLSSAGKGDEIDEDILHIIDLNDPKQKIKKTALEIKAGTYTYNSTKGESIYGNLPEEERLGVWQDRNYSGVSPAMREGEQAAIGFRSEVDDDIDLPPAITPSKERITLNEQIETTYEEAIAMLQDFIMLMNNVDDQAECPEYADKIADYLKEQHKKVEDLYPDILISESAQRMIEEDEKTKIEAPPTIINNLSDKPGSILDQVKRNLEKEEKEKEK